MNNIKYLLMACCLHVSLYGQEVGSDSWVQNEARRLGNKNISEVTQADLPKEHADLVIRELRKRPERSLLIRLRDEVTINEILGRYVELEGRTEFLKQRMADSQSPWLLPLLAPILEEDPTISRRDYGEFRGFDLGYPHATAGLMRQIIYKSHEFPEEVRNSFADKGIDPWLLAGMRRWWTENSEAVKNEAYSKVTVFDHTDLMKKNPMELYGLKESSPTLEPSAEPKQISESAPPSSPQPEDATERGIDNRETVQFAYSTKRILLAISVGIFIVVLISYILRKRK